MKTRSDNKSKKLNIPINKKKTDKKINIDKKKIKRAKKIIKKEVSEEFEADLFGQDEFDVCANDMLLAGLYSAMMKSVKKITECENPLKFLEKDNYSDDNDPDYKEDEKPVTVIKQHPIICPSSTCDHKLNKKTTVTLPTSRINSLDYLISLGKLYHCKNFTTYDGINLKDLYNLSKPLEELHEMIGIEKIKALVAKSVCYFVKGNYRVDNDCGNCFSCINNKLIHDGEIDEHTNHRDDILKIPLICEKKPKNPLHFVIMGPPGTGKTHIAKIIGKIYSVLGVLSKGTFKMINSTDCHSGIIGGTAEKLNDIVNESLGGTLFIDEIYGIGNGGGESNSVSVREFVNALTPILTNFSDLAIGIAGYEMETRTNIFAFNKGLSGRFMRIYQIEQYTSTELYMIFEKMMQSKKLYLLFSDYEEEYKKCKLQCIQKLENNKQYLTDNGRDIESLINCIITYNSSSATSSYIKERNIYYISINDFNEGFKDFVSSKELLCDSGPPMSMYT